MSTATIECGSPDRYAGTWTVSMRMLRTGWILEWEPDPSTAPRGKSLHAYSETSDVFVVPGSTESCFYSTNPGVVRIRIRKHHSTSSRDGALMQQTGQQIRANVHSCADRGTL